MNRFSSSIPPAFSGLKVGSDAGHWALGTGAGRWALGLHSWHRHRQGTGRRLTPLHPATFRSRCWWRTSALTSCKASCQPSRQPLKRWISGITP
jgi:hypothetical protein